MCKKIGWKKLFEGDMHCVGLPTIKKRRDLRKTKYSKVLAYVKLWQGLYIEQQVFKLSAWYTDEQVRFTL